MYKCRLIRSEPVSTLIDLGPQTVSNRFTAAAGTEEFLHPLVVGQCETTGLIQLCDPFPVAELLPVYDWITYSEPEDHLDEMVDHLCQLPGVASDSVICGVTFKDDTTLDRFAARGFTRTWRVDPAEDLGIAEPGAGAETIQDRLTPENARKIVERRGGQADVVVVRHVLEHAYDTLAFMAAVRELAKSGGYVVYEVPDCTRALDTCDYTTLWEEHVLYFTQETFRQAFAASGLALAWSANYPYVFENSLVGVGRVDEGVEPVMPDERVLQQELGRAANFFSSLAERKRIVNDYLAEFRAATGKIALFGAGHLACAFVNYLEIGHHFDFVVDDNPHKKGLYLPGSGLPIKASGALVEEDIKLCLLSLNPLSEDKVIANNQDFVEQGGVFASIFPASDRVFFG
jgi:hypothetical protein